MHPETVPEYMLAYLPQIIVAGFFLYLIAFQAPKLRLSRLVRHIRRDNKMAKKQWANEISQEIKTWHKVAMNSAELTGFSLGGMASIILSTVEIIANKAHEDPVWAVQLEHLAPSIEGLIQAMDACAQLNGGGGSAGDLASDLRMLYRELTTPINPERYSKISNLASESAKKLLAGNFFGRHSPIDSVING